MAKYETELLCPDCGEIVEEDDCYDTETTFIDDGEQIAEIKRCIGHCVNCEKKYKYDEIYTFVGYTNIRGVK